MKSYFKGKGCVPKVKQGKNARELQSNKNIQNDRPHRHPSFSFIQKTRNFIKRSKSTNALVCLFLILSLLGLVYHVYHMSHLYMSYPTLTEIEIKIAEFIDRPSLAVCIYYPKLLNRTSLSTMMKTKRIENLNSTSLELQDVESFLTIKDIFELTPPAEDLLEECIHRIPGRFDLWAKNSEGCKEVYDVEKYFYLHNMCYRFSIKESDFRINSAFDEIRYTYHDLKHHSLYLDFFYEVFLFRKYFEYVTYIESYIFRNDAAPRGNDAFSVSFRRGHFRVHGKTNSRDFYRLSYSMINNHRLPPPYHSNCMNYSMSTGYTSQKKCVDECVLKRVFKTLRKLPFTPIVRDASLDHLLITTKDLEDQSYADKLNILEEKCNNKCSLLDCDDIIYMTRLEKSEPSDSIRFRVQTPHEPDIVITLSPKLDFKEFLVDILNCLGIWLGLSMFDMKKVTVYFLKGTSTSSSVTTTLHNRDTQVLSSKFKKEKTTSKRKRFELKRILSLDRVDEEEVCQEGSSLPFQRKRKRKKKIIMMMATPMTIPRRDQQLRQTGQDRNGKNAAAGKSLQETHSRRRRLEEEGEEDAIRYDFTSKKLILFKRRRQEEVMPHT